MNGKKIVIVGGGTAAWISAILFYEADPSLDITVIYSNDIKTIGVGESTTPMFYNFINKWTSLINEKKFLLETDATLKLGVVHQGWRNGTDVFFNPIDSVDHINSGAHPYDFDYVRSYCVANNIPLDINYESICIKQGIVPFVRQGDKVIKKANYAYHLNVDKTIEFLRRTALKQGIKEITGEVVDIKKDYIVKSLKLKDGLEVEGDFFVDCTGSSSIFRELYTNKWIEKNVSGLNTAVLYNEKTGKTRTYTLARATNDGWEWKIPHKGHRNCGYIFNSSTTCSSCVQEQLQSDKIIKFNPGRIEKFLNRNVLFIGLSSGFVEPLEATSLHLSLIQLKIFLDKYYRSDIQYPNLNYEKYYNKHMSQLWDSTFDWVQMHYFNTRQDTQYWREVTKLPKTENLKDLMDIFSYRMPRITDFKNTQIYQQALVYHILGGMNNLSPHIAQKELEYYNLYSKAKLDYDILQEDNTNFSKEFLSHDELLSNIFDIYN
jgi:tryptophan halogenase